MAWQVVWSQRAVADVEAIAEYIAADSPSYASAVVSRILERTRNLSRFPRSGRKVPEFDNDSVREIFAYSYRVIYRVEAAEHVVIVAVVHGKRLFE